MVVLSWQDLPTRMLEANNSKKIQRESRLRKNESVTLVQDFITCMNEISQILSVAKQSSDSIKNLRDNGFPNLDVPISSVWTEPNVIEKDISGSSDKIYKYLSAVNGQLGKLPELLGDLKTSLDVVCHPSTTLDESVLSR